MRSSAVHDDQAAAATEEEEDKDLFSNFIFPSSDEFATRDYQLNIVTKALLKNTLVVLPTGLGKTFIAAVVMYNYLRWFPDKKIIFLAPTRPLVRQQIEACHEVVGIDERETAEMNGQTTGAKRALLWQKKRVFYCTPQTLERDLDSPSFPRSEISLIVIDEAHRAVGKYAFTTTVEMLFQANPKFRVLALSATPGKDLAKVQEVCTNLLISNIEYKSEADFDVRPYVFQKLLEVVQCEMSLDNSNIVDEFNKLVEMPLKRIKNFGVYTSPLPNARDVSKYFAVSQLNAVSALPNLSTNQMGALRSEWGLLGSLLHVRELFRHGLSTALKYLDTSFDDGKEYGAKAALVKNPVYATFKQRLRTAVDAGQGNPKIAKLTDILLDHFARFNEAGKRTSVIVFAQYRDSVGEICKALEVSCAHLRVSPFVGQANKASSSGKKRRKTKEGGASSSRKEEYVDDDEDEEDEEAEEGLDAAAPVERMAANGQKQSEQQEVVRRFRNGEIDVIVATCIGEEGLDIGSVDLIVSFDALQSPVRMIQRFGRAGRKRAGRVVVLVADEKERHVFDTGTKMSGSVHKLLRDNLWKLQLFVPPAEFCMFPNPAHKPKVKFVKLVIEKYQSELVGGTKLRKPKQEERDWAMLTEDEQRYLDARFGSSSNRSARGQTSFPVAETLEEVVARWRFPASGNAMRTSSRCGVVQHAAKFVGNAMSVPASSQTYASVGGDEEEEDERILQMSCFAGRAVTAVTTTTTTTSIAMEEDSQSSTRTTDEEVVFLRDEMDKRRQCEEDDLVPEPPSDWDSGEEESDGDDDVMRSNLDDFFPTTVTTPRETKSVIKTPSSSSSSPVSAHLQAEESQSPFMPKRPRQHLVPCSLDGDASQSPRAPRGKRISTHVEEDEPAAAVTSLLPATTPARVPRASRLVQFSTQDTARTSTTEEKREKKRKREKRGALVRNAFISMEADCEEESEDEEGEEEDSDLDGDLDSFIDDSTPRKEGGSNLDTAQSSATTASSSCFSKSPIDRIHLMHKSSRVAAHYGNGVIGQTLQGLRHRVENGLAPPSVVEEEEEEDLEEEEDSPVHSEAEEYDSPLVKQQQQQQSRRRQSKIVVEEDEDSPVRVLDFSEPQVTRTMSTTTASQSNNAPLVSYVPSPALPPVPPALDLLADVKPQARIVADSVHNLVPPQAPVAAAATLLSHDLKQQIELKRQLALQKLNAAKQQQQQQLPARGFAPPSLLGANPLRQHPPPQPSPFPLAAPLLPPPAPVSLSNNTPLLSPPTTSTSTNKSVLLYNHASPAAAAAFRALLPTHGHQLDLQMCPHLCFFGADALVSSQCSLRLVSVKDLLGGELAAWLTSIVARTPHIILVLHLATLEQQEEYKAQQQACQHAISQLKSHHHPNLVVPVAQNAQVLGNLVMAFCKREDAARRRNAFHDASWRTVLWKNKQVIEFVTRASNAVIALSLTMHFARRTLRELVDSTDVSLLCGEIAPGLDPVLAQAMLTSLRESFAEASQELKSICI